VDGAGDLVVHAGGAELRQHQPVVYQDVNGIRRPVNGEFAIRHPQSAIGDRATV
jgi:hypothetical protein